jgi:hypothetical protein
VYRKSRPSIIARRKGASKQIKIGVSFSLYRLCLVAYYVAAISSAQAPTHVGVLVSIFVSAMVTTGNRRILETITILARIVRQKPPITNVRDHVELAITWNCNSSVEAHLRTLLNIFRRHRDDLPVGRCPIRAQRNHWKEHWLSQQVAYTIQPRANVEKDVKLSNVIGSEAARAAAARRPRFNPFRVSSTTVGGPPKLHPSSHVNRSLTQPIPALP